MSVEDVFGELRSLLSQAPSEALWEQICALCDAEVAHDAGRFEAEVLPYVSDGLLGWPDALRTAPQGWIDAISAAGAHPCGSLVRRIARQPAGDGRLLAAPCLAQVTELSLSVLGVPSADALEGASMLKALRVLELGNADPQGAGVRFEQMPALTTLHAGFGERSGRGPLLDALKRSGRLAALEALWMGCAGLEAADMERLDVCKQLRELAVWSNHRLGDAGVAAACEALKEAPLVHLNVGGCGLTGASVARIAQTPWRLEQLLIWGNALSEDAATVLGEHEAFGALRMLQLSKTGLSGAALAPLLSRRGPQPLRELRCADQGELSAASWSAAAQGDTARGLEVLHARQAKLGAGGAFEGLLEGMEGGRMRRLLIPSNKLGAAHMMALRDARLPNLRELDLSDNLITNAGLEALLAASWFEGLEILKVSKCHLNKAILGPLRALSGRALALRELHMHVAGISTAALIYAIGGALPQIKLQLKG
jgi:hypothetical protein